MAVLALIALAVFLGLRAGYRAATTTETDVIEAAARDYMRRTGRPATDCIARPDPGSDLLVLCRDGQGAGYLYRPTLFLGLAREEIAP